MSLTEEEQNYIKQLETEMISMSNNQQTQNYSMPSSAMFGSSQKSNLVEWQLDFRPELEDIEHLLKSDVLTIDPRTKNEHWQRNPNKAFVVFNDQGVNDIIREIRMFLNKNTVLSNYREEDLSIRIKYIGHELRALIYNNFERYGIDNEYKENNYAIIVLTILSMIESAYRRALNGEERRDLNSARIVQQNEPIGQPGYPMMMGGMPQQSKKSILKPWTWGN